MTDSPHAVQDDFATLRAEAAWRIPHVRDELNAVIDRLEERLGVQTDRAQDYWDCWKRTEEQLQSAQHELSARDWSNDRVRLEDELRSTQEQHQAEHDALVKIAEGPSDVSPPEIARCALGWPAHGWEKDVYEQLEAAQERLALYETPGWINPVQKVLALQEQLETLRNALIGMRELASVSYNGDPWYAENDGLNAGDVFDRAREALGESTPASNPLKECPVCRCLMTGEVRYCPNESCPASAPAPTVQSDGMVGAGDSSPASRPDFVADAIEDAKFPAVAEHYCIGPDCPDCAPASVPHQGDYEPPEIDDWRPGDARPAKRPT